MTTEHANRLYIKSTPEEKKRWQKHARDMNYNGLSPLIRILMRESIATGTRGDDIRKELENIRRELSAQGNNLNQIAKRVNVGEQIGNISEELQEIQRIRKQLGKLVTSMRGRLS